MPEIRRVEILIPGKGNVNHIMARTEETWQSDACDGAGPHEGKIWRYPLPEHAGVFLCQRCWGKENMARYNDGAYQVRYPLA